MSNQTNFERLGIYYLGRPDTGIIRTIGGTIDSAATTLRFSAPLLKADGTVITEAFIIGVMIPDGYVEGIYIPANGLDSTGTIASGVTRGLNPSGYDITASKPTGSSDFAVDLPDGSIVGVPYHTYQQELFAHAIMGDISTGGQRIVIGDETDNDTDIDRRVSAGTKRFLRYDYSASKAQFSDDGSTFTNMSTIGAHGNSANLKDHIDVAAAVSDSPVTGDLLQYDGADWNKSTVSSVIGANVQNQTNVYAASAAGTDTYAITLSPAISAYALGQRFTFKADVANTGACSLNVNAKGAKAIKKMTSGAKADLEDNDIIANMLVSVKYDGTDMMLDCPTANQISSASKAALVGGSVGDQQHYHRQVCLQTTRNINATSSTVTLAHGLAATPKYIHVVARMSYAAASTTGISVTSEGFSDGTNNYCNYVDGNTLGANPYPPILTAGNSATKCVHIATFTYGDSGSLTNQQEATANFDGTNVSLVFTKTATGAISQTIYLQVIVFA